MMEFLWVILASLAPVSELRGAIPMGIVALGLPSYLVIIISVIFNCLVFFPVYFFLELAYRKYFIRYSWCRNRLEKFRKKGEPYVERYGAWGILFFVAIPLPMTGAWTGTIVAWALGLEWKKSVLPICVGVIIAAAIVSAVVLGGLEIFKIFVKS